MVKTNNNIQQAIVKQIKAHNLKSLKFLIDFKVRWNSTYLMLTRLKRLVLVYKDLTETPNSLDNISVSC